MVVVPRAARPPGRRNDRFIKTEESDILLAEMDWLFFGFVVGPSQFNSKSPTNSNLSKPVLENRISSFEVNQTVPKL